MEFRVVQALDGVHGLFGIGHVHEGEVLDDGTLRDDAVLLEKLPELLFEALFHVGDVDLHGTHVALPSAQLHVDGPAVQLVQV